MLFVFPYSSSSSSTTRFLCCRYQGLVEFVRIIWSDYTAYQQTRHLGCFETVFFLIGRCNFPTFRQRGLQWLESSLEYFLHGFVEHFEVFVLRFGANLLRWPSTWGPRRITKFMRCGRKIIKLRRGVHESRRDR